VHGDRWCRGGQVPLHGSNVPHPSNAVADAYAEVPNTTMELQW
jgi:hypothetical protein